MKKSLGLTFLILALIHYGASAPRQVDTGDAAGNSKKPESSKASVSPQGFATENSKKSGTSTASALSQSSAMKNSKKSGDSKASVSPQGFAADQILKFFGRKTGKDLGAEKKSKDQKGGSAFSQVGENSPGVFELPPKPVALGVSNVTKVPALAGTNAFQRPQVVRTVNTSTLPKVYTVAKVNKLAVPPPPVSQVAVPQIRQEIQKILDLNKQIKTIQGGRAGQFQRVQEQAKLHQKILNQIEAAPEGEANPGSKTPSKEALLAQEKLRIIHEETQRNAALLEAVDSENATASFGQDSASSARALQFKEPDASVDSVPESELEPRNS